MTLAELQGLDAGRWLPSRKDTGASWLSWTGPEFSGERVPTSAQLFDHRASESLNLMLEIKDIGDDGPAKLVEEIQSRPGLAERVIVIL